MPGCGEGWLVNQAETHGREMGFDGAQTSCLCDCGLSSCCRSQGRCGVRPRHGPCLTPDPPPPPQAAPPFLRILLGSPALQC